MQCLAIEFTVLSRDLEIDPLDFYDLLELDRRTDRILSNGWCLLPPRQSCVKGNACLSCDKFATARSRQPLSAGKYWTAIPHRNHADGSRSGFVGRGGRCVP